MIKRLADACRGGEGYAGMAVYHRGILLFRDGLDPDVADKCRRLFEESESVFEATRMAAVIRGFTVTAFRAESLLIVCGFEGRFTRPPELAEEGAAEYASGRQEDHPLTREEAKQEAELILRRLMGTR